MTDAELGVDPDRIIKSVAVGSNRLEIGASPGTLISPARDEPAEAAEEGSRLSRAVAREDKDDNKRRGAVGDVELVSENADAGTTQVERGVALWTAVAAGRIDVSAVNNEIDTLLAVLEKLDRAGRFDEQLRLARALSGLLGVALRWLDLLRSLRQLLRAAERHGDANAKAWALHELGTLHLAAGKLVEADHDLSEARQLRQELGDRRGLAATDHNLQVLCRALRQMMREGHLVERRGFRKLLHTPLGLLAAVLVVAIGATTVAAASGSFGGSGHPPRPKSALAVPKGTNRPAPVASTTRLHAATASPPNSPAKANQPSTNQLNTPATTKSGTTSTRTKQLATVAFSSGLPPSGTVDDAYNFDYTAAGDTGITFSVTQGTLAPGLSLSPTGVLSGTPTRSGSFAYTVTATGASGAHAQEANTVTIALSTITFTSGPPPSGCLARTFTVCGTKVPYSFTYTATGDTGITYAVTAGSTDGLTLSPVGVLSGTPPTDGTGCGSFQYTVTATGASGAHAEEQDTVIVEGC